MDYNGDSPSKCDCKEPHTDVIEFLQEQVDLVFTFRDRFFENHNIEEAINKSTDLEKLLKTTLVTFNKHESLAIKGSRSKYNFLRGRLLNVLPQYNKTAEEYLSKAIKLDPKLVAAWNELGECYWKNDEFEKARHCFEGALKEKVNKVSLRNLSMLARQESAKNSEERVKNVELGLKYAKEAVQLDAHDGLSWCILGNAHLSNFFGVQQNPKILKQCLSAYAQAEKDIIARSTPDLHYNKGITLKYEEEFQAALECFNEALLYDPTWDMPKLKENQLTMYLKEINDLVATSGKMKPKRLNQILQSIDPKQLGPYSGGTYTSTTTKQTVKLEHINFNDLLDGLNQDKVVLGKVVCSVRNDETVPFTFCLVDKLGTCVVVTVFNLADGKGVIIGDSVAIPDPFVTNVNFSYKENTFKFKLIRLETPLVLVVNSKKVGRELQAGVQMTLFKKFD